MTSILIMRLLQGVGIGAEMPLVLTYLMEFVPVRRRGVFSATTISLWNVAGLLAALAAIVIIPAFTWRGMFVLGGLPHLLWRWSSCIYRSSICYLVRRNRLNEAENIVKWLSTIDPATAPIEPTVVHARIGITDILRGKYLRYTLGAWLMSITWSMAFFGMSVWLPSLLVRSGFTLVHSFAYTAVITGAGAMGVFMSGFFMDWLGRRAATALGFASGV